MPKRKSEEMSVDPLWSFVVGGAVHNGSWGVRSEKFATDRNGLVVKPWSSDDFHLESKIAQGYFGKVYRATYLRDGYGKVVSSPTSVTGHSTGDDFYALKRFSKADIISGKGNADRTLEILEREINIQSHLHHRNIVPMHGYYEDHYYLYMVLEYAPHGDLMTRMHHCTDSLDKLELGRQVLSQMCQAVDYLQSMQVSHRDIKPENIVLTRDDKFKLADFGWATWWQPGHRRTTLCGTPEYVPPEMLKKKISYDAEYVDLWALGVLTLDVVHGSTPFCADSWEDSRENRDQVFGKIRSFAGIATDSEHNFHSECHDFVSRLLQTEPSDRLSTRQAMDHPFLQGLRRTALTDIQSPTVAQRRQLFQYMMNASPQRYHEV